MTDATGAPPQGDSTLDLPDGAWVFDDRCDVAVIDGPDAAQYLQGQMAADVTLLDVGDATWSLLLAPQGQIDGWGRLCRVGEATFTFAVESGWGDGVGERLRRFLIRTKAEVSSATWWRRHIRDVGEAIGGWSLPTTAVPPGGVAAAVTWPGGGCDVMSPSAFEPIEDPNQVRDADYFELARIAAASPKLGQEVVHSTIPAAAGIVEGSASFTKGCYVGQELVARVDSRGSNTPERLRRLASPHPAHTPATGTSLLMGTDVVGRVTSAAPLPDGRWVGLGYLHRGVQVPNTATLGEAGGSEVDAEEAAVTY